jgi:hypothetical protein
VFDDRYIQLDQYSFDKLIEQNHMKDQLEKLPGLSTKELNHPIFLFSRNYIFLERKCLKQINKNIADYYDDDYKFNTEFLEFAEKILTNLNNKFYLIYMLILIYTFLEMMYYMVITKYLEEFEDCPRNWLGKVITEGIGCFLLFLLIVTCVISMKKMYSLKKIFELEDCSDIYSNIHFTAIYSHFYYFYVENLILIVLGLVSFVILCYSIIKYSHNTESDEGKIDNNLKKMFELSKFE